MKKQTPIHLELAPDLQAQLSFVRTQRAAHKDNRKLDNIFKGIEENLLTLKLLQHTEK